MITDDQAINFAKTCQLHNFSPADLMALCRKARQRAVAEANRSMVQSGRGDRRADRLQSEVNLLARKMGFKKVEWNGLYPTLTLPDDSDFHLPC